MINGKVSLRQFKYSYGTHEKCLEAIKQLKFPDDMECSKCKRLSVFYPVTGRTAYACKFCGYQIYPLKGTIFEKSTTPLDLWFFAMYLMVQTRSGTSAKQLERMLGVSYKTAHRMFKQIRKLMEEEHMPLSGNVEIDETFVGGLGKNRATKPNFNEIPKEVVWGAVEREGKVIAKHVPNTGKYTLLEQVQKNISKDATIMSDNYPGYIQLSKYGYHHFAVNHGVSEYVRGQIHTNTIEGVWSQLKRGIHGVYRHVSKEYLQSYVNEYTFRYNHRASGNMFEDLFKQIQPVSVR